MTHTHACVVRELFLILDKGCETPTVSPNNYVQIVWYARQTYISIYGGDVWGYNKKGLAQIHKIMLHYYRCVLNVNTLRPRQNGRHFPDDIFKWIFLNENVRISINISLKFVPKGPINNIPIYVHVMAWRRPGDKPLSEPMMVRLPTYICVTRPQWVKASTNNIITFG